MATLAADVAVVFDPSRTIGLRQAPANSADTFFRGGFPYYTAGELDLTPAATMKFAGVLMEHRVTTATGDLVWIATGGRFHIANTSITAANMEDGFAQAAAALFDNPADLVIAVAGTAGTVGVLDQVTVEATSGWLDISRRAPAEDL